MNKAAWWILAVLIGLSGCAVKPQSEWVNTPHKTGAFEGAAFVTCGTAEKPERCLDRARAAAEGVLAKRLNRTLSAVIETFVRENGLGDAEVGEWLLEGIRDETVDRLLSRAQRSESVNVRNETGILLSVPRKEAHEIVKKAIIRAVKYDELLYEQAVMIRAFDELDALLERY